MRIWIQMCILKRRIQRCVKRNKETEVIDDKEKGKEVSDEEKKNTEMSVEKKKETELSTYVSEDRYI
jgi:hypothetical protein